MGADKILVLNHGRVEEMGTHEELIQNQGIYQRIYEIQMGADDRKDILAFADP
jgi:ATP-binding cassette subfamily B protein